MTFTIQLSTNRGTFMMNRHDLHQPHAIVNTGRPHIDHEIEALLAISDRLADGAVFVDAGANIGLISIPMALRLQERGGRVVAFEPQRLTYYMLAGNAALAGLSNIYCHQIALSSEPGSIMVPERDPHQHQDFGAVSLDSGEVNEIEVRAVPIDLLGLDRLDLLKIDVEGMELEVLDGAAQTIAASRPYIWIEVWPNNYESVVPWFAYNKYTIHTFDALNFCAVPDEKLENFPFKFPRFDGVTNPFFVEAFGDQASQGAGQ